MPRDTDVHIRTRAYAIWEAEGRPHGRDLDHWLQAEAETGPPARPKAAASRAKAPAKRAKALGTSAKAAAKPAKTKAAAKPAAARSRRAPKTSN